MQGAFVLDSSRTRIEYRHSTMFGLHRQYLVRLLVAAAVVLPRHAELNFVTILYGLQPEAPHGVPALLPAIDYALERSSLLYPAAFRNYTHTFRALNISDCRENGGVYPLITELYDEGVFERNGTNIIIYGACLQQFQPVGDFSRELDMLVLSCNAEDATMTNRVRYPTSVSVSAGAITSYGRALLALMDYFHWKSIAVINDYRKLTALWTRSREECRGFLEQLRTRSADIATLEIPVEDGDYSRPLRTARGFSRIILSCMLGREQKELLLAAHITGMTNGDFVFLHPFESQVPGEPPLSLDQNDGLDLEASFEKTWIIRSVPIDWLDLSGYLETVLRRRLFMFPNFPEALATNEKQKSEFTLACLRAVEATAAALNETVYGGLTLNGKAQPSPGGRQIAKVMMGREFETRSGPLRVSNVGTQEIIVHLQVFDKVLRDFKTVLLYDTRTDNIEIVGYNVSCWTLGIVPVDRPLCGLNGEHCGSTHLMTRDLPAGICALGATLLITIGLVWWRWKPILVHSDWWLVSDVDIQHAPSQISGFGSKMTRPSAHPPKLFPLTVSDERIVWIKGVQAYQTSLASDTTPLECSANAQKTAQRQLRKLMHQIHGLDHININPFVGVRFSAHLDCLDVFEKFCGRGSVEDLIAMQRMDDPLRYSLVKDCIMGLRYLHGTPLKFHGHLKLSRCLIDRQLTLKISGIVNSKMRRASGCSHEDSLWSAPERLRKDSGTSAADMYAFAVVAYQIFTERTLHQPVNVDPGPNGQTRSPELQPSSLSSRHPPALLDILRKCLSDNPSQRPSAQEAAHVVGEMAAMHGLSGTLFDCISQRLNAYFAVLEDQVLNRKRQLFAEQKRCDAILMEMLPEKVVTTLRRAQLVEPELFQITLFMSVICEFSELVDCMTPTQLVEAMTRIFELYDHVCRKFTVYKVEINRETIVVASGLLVPIGVRHVEEICSTALELHAAFALTTFSKQLTLQAGIHTGPVAAGVVGVRLPRYCLFGDTINTTSRLETNGMPGKTHVSEQTRQAGSAYGFTFEGRGTIAMKGKDPMTSYWLTGREDLVSGSQSKQ